jgi:16S rRNA (adenine1518-N6/adenine1519-N6)-dimethyltransferase
MLLRWKKRFGQHLLHDHNILRKIVVAAQLSGKEYVVEIGCGSGALTAFLLEQGVRVFGVEIDEQFYGTLQDKFEKYDTFTLITRDIMEFELESILPASSKAVVIGNLPYNITSQILFHLIRQRNFVSRMLFLIQKEVAKRIVAAIYTKDRGILSTVFQYHTDPKMLFNVSRNCFFPKPKVDSSVISLRFKEIDGSIRPENYFHVVKTCFGQRRKTLKNSLMTIGWELPENISHEFDLSLRPEELEIDTFVALAKAVYKNNTEKAGIV